MDSTQQTQDTADRILREYCLERATKRLEGRKQPKMFGDATPQVCEALRTLDLQRFRDLEKWWGLVANETEKELVRRRALEKEEDAKSRQAAKAKRAERKAKLATRESKPTAA